MQLLALIVTHCIQCNLFPKQLLHFMQLIALMVTNCIQCNLFPKQLLHSVQLIPKQFIGFNETHFESNSCTQCNSFQSNYCNSVQLFSQSMQLITFNSFDSIKLIPIPKATLALITTHCIQCNSLH